MSDPLERLVAASRERVRDNRHSALWHFIRANWPKIKRLKRERMTFLAMAEILSADPEALGFVGARRSQITAQSVRAAYWSVSELLGEGGPKSRRGQEVPAIKSASIRAGLPKPPMNRIERMPEGFTFGSAEFRNGENS